MRWMSQPGENKPTARPAITHSSGMPRLRGSVGRWVLLRSHRGAGAAGARGGGGCTLARSIAALARRALESEAASRGGVLGGGWRRSRPITEATAPPQRSPPLASRLGGGGDRRRLASSAPVAAAALGLQLPTGPAAGPGSERGRRARPENPQTSWRPSRVPLDFHGDSRHLTKPGRLDALMHGSPGRATASPPPAGPHPRG